MRRTLNFTKVRKAIEQLETESKEREDNKGTREIMRELNIEVIK